MMRTPPPPGWSVAWGTIGESTPAREAFTVVGDGWKCCTPYATPDAALEAAKDADRRARAGEGIGSFARIAVVVRHGMRPRWLVVDGEAWAVGEDGKLGGRL